MNAISIEGFPLKSTYCVAICPFSASLFSISGPAMNRPSPCDTGIVNTSPVFTPASHGDFTDVTPVLTRHDAWRPILLYVSVALSSVPSTILPSGTSPSFIRAWKPLHIPSISPSLFSSRSATASFILGFLNTAVMNLADPSGSSPPENPPGSMII